MGREVAKAVYTDEEVAAFTAAIQRQARVVETRLTAKPGEPGYYAKWQVNPGTRGSETEYVIVDRRTGRVRRIAREVLPARDWADELGEWNVEHGGQVVPAGTAKPYTLMLAELMGAEVYMDKMLEAYDAVVGSFGIAPSLTPDDLQHLQRTPRFDALGAEMDRHHGPCKLVMDWGPESLSYDAEGIDIEALCTTRQLHIATSAAQLCRVVNALRLAASVIIGLAGNSPFVFGRKVSLNEARLEIFVEAVRNRGHGLGPDWMRHPAGQVRHAIESPVLLAEVSDEPDDALQELTLQMGTYWAYVRMVLDAQLLRVENRYVPAGPSNVDMISNDAATEALIYWLMPVIDQIAATVPFQVLRDNFRSAVRYGPGAPIYWPDANGFLRETTPAGVALEFQPELHQALIGQGVADGEAALHLQPFLDRARTGMTGAEWLIQAADRLPHTRRMERLTLEAVERQKSGDPVARWSLPSLVAA
jgi:hypothetical protein